MSETEFNRDEIRKKIEAAKKAMIKQNQCPDGLGEDIIKVNESNDEDFDGVILSPDNEMDKKRILKEIEKNAVNK